jgi:tetratricopeptide (TPR) repeat protein
MATRPDHAEQQVALQRSGEASQHARDSIAALFARAEALHALGRDEDAKAAYLAVLAHDPTHFGALTNLGRLVHALGHRSAARTAFAQAVAHHPDEAIGRANLAFALADLAEPEAARVEYEMALRLDPGLVEAHQGLANLLAAAGDEAGALRHWRTAFEGRPIRMRAYRGAVPPIVVLVLATITGANIPMLRWLDDRVFQIVEIAVEFCGPDQALPPHHLVLQAIGDGDRCPGSLHLAAAIARRSSAPMINPTEAVLATGRAENAARLAGMPGLRTPRIRLYPRALLEAPDAAGQLGRDGFVFPLLLRAPGYHAGQHFQRVEAPEALPAALAVLPGDTLAALEFLDARGPDGLIRKYRAMFVDGRIFPLHAAVSTEWKVHYFSADMVESPANRAEDAAFLADMAGVLGMRALETLEQVRWALGLDYAGIDFGLAPDGTVLLFEANATMVVPQPAADPRWDYRRAPVQRIVDALRSMLVTRAQHGGE